MIDENNPPKKEYMSVDSWERSLDPWHEDAFPEEFRHIGSGGIRKEGWMGIDWCGNPIVFIADGTEE